MDELVMCPCGHAMSSHDDAGCHGDRRHRCACPQTRIGALEAAIDASRLRPGQSLPFLHAE
jgi:hypothetical protein